jgi:hypothetical protein
MQILEGHSSPPASGTLEEGLMLVILTLAEV